MHYFLSERSHPLFDSFQPLQKGSEVAAEDDQVFLLKMQAQLNQQVSTTGSPVSNILNKK